MFDDVGFAVRVRLSIVGVCWSQLALDVAMAGTRVGVGPQPFDEGEISIPLRVAMRDDVQVGDAASGTAGWTAWLA